MVHSLCFRVPGQLNDRRTMLGELNWIFTAITDTIAWNTLPRGKTMCQVLSNINKHKLAKRSNS